MQKTTNSISTKMIAMVVSALLLTVVVILAIVIPKTKSEIRTAIENNMLDLAELYGELVDIQLEENGGSLTNDQVASIVSEAGIRGFDSSYAYVIDQDGVFLYHKKEEKIGTVVINDFINNLLTEIPSGNYEQSGIFHYTDENGLVKYGAYYVCDTTPYTVVVLGTQADVMATINQTQRIALITAALIVIFCIFVSLTYSHSITKPLKQMTALLNRTADLDFSMNDDLEKLKSRTDETGEICRASLLMQESLREMVEHMDGLSSNLTGNSHKLKEIAVVIADASNNNSATSQELAAYMEETSATTENINVNIAHISESASHISDMSQVGVETTTKLKKQAESLNNQAIEMQENAVNMCNTVKDKSQEAIEKSKAVEKINVLSNTIMEISEQTSLLALNASIEAARAGEQGKGFAVVASEIGALANQSSDAVQSIVEIVSEVKNAVSDLTNCLGISSKFIEENVIPDYETFLEGSNVYNQAAQEVEASMADICTHIEELTSSSRDIAEAIDAINRTVGEEAEGVTDIAQKTTEVVASVSEVRDMVDDTSDYADDLMHMVESFHL